MDMAFSVSVFQTRRCLICWLNALKTWISRIGETVCSEELASVLAAKSCASSVSLTPKF